VLPGVEFEQWLSDEPDGSRREAVERWLMSLAKRDPLFVLMTFPDDDPSAAIEIPDTNLIATCIAIPILDVIVIERIGSVGVE